MSIHSDLDLTPRTPDDELLDRRDGLLFATSAPAFRKEIVYDRESRDYAMYLNGELVGFARTYHRAEVELDERVYEQLSRHADESHVCGDCGAALSDLGQCEECQERAAWIGACEFESNLQADADDETDDPEPGAPLTLPQAVALAVNGPDACYVCGAAAWQRDYLGPLCPGHFAVIEEYNAILNAPLFPQAPGDELPVPISHDPDDVIDPRDELAVSIGS